MKLHANAALSLEGGMSCRPRRRAAVAAEPDGRFSRLEAVPAVYQRRTNVCLQRKRSGRGAGAGISESGVRNQNHRRESRDRTRAGRPATSGSAPKTWKPGRSPGELSASQASEAVSGDPWASLCRWRRTSTTGWGALGRRDGRPRPFDAAIVTGR
jgi:hypothetical protein